MDWIDKEVERLDQEMKGEKTESNGYQSAPDLLKAALRDCIWVYHFLFDLPPIKLLFTKYYITGINLNIHNIKTIAFINIHIIRFFKKGDKK